VTDQPTLPLTDPSSSPPAPAASSSAPPPAPAAASPSNQPDPAAAASTRPDGIPESYWDSTTNALKVDQTALIKDLKERDELKAFKATEDSRKLTLPQKPEDFKLDLPKDFKAPEGMTFEFNKTDPILTEFQKIAHARGMDQDTFSAALGAFAAAKVQEQAQIDTAQAAEIGKLGVNGPARVDAVKAFLTAQLGDGAKPFLNFPVISGMVEGFEKLMRSFSSQGSSTFSQQHRAQPATDKIEGWDTMSFEQRRQAQDQLAANRRAH
jgi:hypothetical protein